MSGYPRQLARFSLTAPCRNSLHLFPIFPLPNKPEVSNVKYVTNFPSQFTALKRVARLLKAAHAQRPSVLLMEFKLPVMYG